MRGEGRGQGVKGQQGCAFFEKGREEIGGGGRGGCLALLVLQGGRVGVVVGVCVCGGDVAMGTSPPTLKHTHTYLFT